MTRRFLGAALALLLVATGCSNDDAAPATPSSEPPATTVAPTAVAPTTAGPDATASPDTTAPTTAPASSVPDTTAVVPSPGGYPAQPAGVAFPTTQWPTGTLPAGVDRAAVDAAVDEAFGADDAEARVRSVVVIQGGQLVYERYHPKDGPDTVMSSYSVAKSFTSAIVGLLIGDGVLALDQDHLRPEWTDGRSAITLRELLQMSSGLQWTEDANLVASALGWLQSPSAAAIVAEQPLAEPPGTEFSYSTATSALVAGIAADAIGGCSELDAYLHERLLDPIGITTEQITTDGGGCFIGGFGMDMTTRDFARFGLLYVRGGVWDGVQVLPGGWVDETRVAAPTNDIYGLHWWLSDDGHGFSAEGLFRQRIVVVPELDLVVATNSTNGGAPDPMVTTIIDQYAAALG